MSPQEKFISVHGDTGQADRLVSAKKQNQSAPNSPFLGNYRTASNGPSKANGYSTRHSLPANAKSNSRSPFRK